MSPVGCGDPCETTPCTLGLHHPHTKTLEDQQGCGGRGEGHSWGGPRLRTQCRVSWLGSSPHPQPPRSRGLCLRPHRQADPNPPGKTLKSEGSVLGGPQGGPLGYGLGDRVSGVAPPYTHSLPHTVAQRDTIKQRYTQRHTHADTITQRHNHRETHRDAETHRET